MKHDGRDSDLAFLVDEAADDGTVPHAALLVRFTEALITGTDTALEAARREMAETLGNGSLVDAAAVAAAFEGFTRIADATGIPTESIKVEMTEDLRSGLGAEAFTGARNIGDVPQREGAESATWGPARAKQI